MRERNSAERMQFAYALMTEKAKELQSAKVGVHVFFVITQCDQYKALLSTNLELFEAGLKGLIAGMPSAQIKRIYMSSVYQTELKQIGAESAVKFCPVPVVRKNNRQPGSLGIKTLVGCICDVSLRKKAMDEEIMLGKWNMLKTELDRLGERAERAIEEARGLIAKLKTRTNDRLYDFDLNNDIRRVESALSAYRKAKAGDCYTIPGWDAVHSLEEVVNAVRLDLGNSVRLLEKTVDGTRSRYGI